jgi:hypothetical protein
MIRHLICPALPHREGGGVRVTSPPRIVILIEAKDLQFA